MNIMKPLHLIHVGVAVCAVTLTPAWTQQETPEENQISFDDTRALLQQWIEAEEAISKERNDWKLGKQILEDRISMVKSEIETLKTQIVEAKEEIIKADQDREKVIQENEDLKAVSEELKAIVTGLETDLKKSILSNLTDPARSKLEVFIKRIPDDPNNENLSMSQRFSNVVGLIDQINKANGEILLESELRTVEGKEVSVQSMYLGLGQAFYVTNQMDKAGVGRPGDGDGWTWTPINNRAPEIARAISILNGDEIAEFVPVPVKINQ